MMVLAILAGVKSIFYCIGCSIYIYIYIYIYILGAGHSPAGLFMVHLPVSQKVIQEPLSVFDRLG